MIIFTGNHCITLILLAQHGEAPLTMKKEKNTTPPSEQPVKKLRLGWLWASPDQWMFHRTTKDGLWQALEGDSISVVDLLKLLSVKEEWIEMRQEDKIPVNYPLLLFAWGHYLKVYRKMNPSLLYRLGIKKLGIFILTLYKEDSAYIERIGGAIEYIIDHKEDWPKGDKQARLLALEDLRNWWYEEDWRVRGKERLLRLFNKIIELYDTDEFIRKTIDYFIDTFIANAEKWDRAGGFYKPEKWYPRGKGQINYIVHGRAA